MPKELMDTFGRKIDYIRVSVTKNCNFRCLYCMPATQNKIHENLIPLDSMLEFIKIAIDYGVRKVRITGGEPLLREGLGDFIKGICDYGAQFASSAQDSSFKSAQDSKSAKNGIEVALTTNGFLLEKYAKELKDSGLRRVNVSLDSLQNETIAKISHKSALQKILRGIDAAQNVGLGVKLNAVVLKGVNDGEICDLLRFANARGVLIRFIEYMDNAFGCENIRALKSNEILGIIRAKYDVREIPKPFVGSAKIYEITNLKARDSKNRERNAVFGIIAPHDDAFCAACNRLRITGEGIICPCLYFEDSIDASEAIRARNKAAMEAALLGAVRNKPEKNKWQSEPSARAFFHTGG